MISEGATSEGAARDPLFFGQGHHSALDGELAGTAAGGL
jgi:hypothetical protein